jgi:hypothetical protein
MFRIRLERPWHYGGQTFGDVELSTTIPVQNADAVVCEFEPTALLFSFRGPAFWYASEPVTNPKVGIQSRRWLRRARARLASWQFLYHAHPDEHLRMPCFTHHAGELTTADAATRKSRVVAVCSQQTRSRAPALQELRMRTELNTHPLVDLWGSRGIWMLYRRSALSLPRVPDNYQGTLPGGGGSPEKIALLSQYHAVVCLENSHEPHYFTEKFVDAARAGCVPIYHAHSTVRDRFLKGARWVDPASFDFDTKATLEFALAQDRALYADANRAWMRSRAVAKTSWEAVFERICLTVRDRVRGHRVGTTGPQ